MISILSPIKALSLSFIASTYETLSYNDAVSDLLFYSNLIIKGIHLFLFTFFIGLACDGYGVLYEKINISSLKNYGFACFGLAMSSGLISIFDNPDVILYLLFTSLVFGFYFFNLLNQSLLTSLLLQHRSEFATLLYKSSHVLYFNLSVIACFVILATFQCFAIFKEIENNLSDAISEMIEFAIYVIMSLFFLLRKSFKGEYSPLLHKEACNIIEPGSKITLVFLQKDENET